MKRWIVIAAVIGMMGAAGFPAVAGTLTWDAVTTDIDGMTETIATYRCYSRKAGTSDAWVKFGETAGTTITRPTSSARQEYAVTAVDAAGNESALSLPASAKPNAPANLTVVK